jgi:hypothetical protein
MVLYYPDSNVSGVSSSILVAMDKCRMDKSNVFYQLVFGINIIFSRIFIIVDIDVDRNGANKNV